MDQVKTKVLTVRMSDEDYEDLAKMSVTLNKPRSAIVRDLLNKSFAQLKDQIRHREQQLSAMGLDPLKVILENQPVDKDSYLGLPYQR